MQCIRMPCKVCFRASDGCFNNWLIDVDKAGASLAYSKTLEENFDSVEQLLKTYTSKSGDSQKLDQKMFSDIGVTSLVHRQLCMKNFEDHDIHVSSSVAHTLDGQLDLLVSCPDTFVKDPGAHHAVKETIAEIAGIHLNSVLNVDMEFFDDIIQACFKTTPAAGFSTDAIGAQFMSNSSPETDSEILSSRIFDSECIAAVYETTMVMAARVQGIDAIASAVTCAAPLSSTIAATAATCAPTVPFNPWNGFEGVGTSMPVFNNSSNHNSNQEQDDNALPPPQGNFGGENNDYDTDSDNDDDDGEDNDDDDSVDGSGSSSSGRASSRQDMYKNETRDLTTIDVNSQDHTASQQSTRNKARRQRQGNDVNSNKNKNNNMTACILVSTQ